MLALITGLSAMTEWVRGIIEKVAGLVPGTKLKLAEICGR